MMIRTGLLVAFGVVLIGASAVTAQAPGIWAQGDTRQKNGAGQCPTRQV